MGQVKLNGKKQRLLIVGRKGEPLARIDYRRVRHPRTKKISHILGGRIKLLPSSG